LHTSASNCTPWPAPPALRGSRIGCPSEPRGSRAWRARSGSLPGAERHLVGGPPEVCPCPEPAGPPACGGVCNCTCGCSIARSRPAWIPGRAVATRPQRVLADPPPGHACFGWERRGPAVSPSGVSSTWAAGRTPRAGQGRVCRAHSGWASACGMPLGARVRRPGPPRSPACGTSAQSHARGRVPQTRTRHGPAHRHRGSARTRGSPLDGPALGQPVSRPQKRTRPACEHAPDGHRHGHSEQRERGGEDDPGTSALHGHPPRCPKRHGGRPGTARGQRDQQQTGSVLSSWSLSQGKLRMRALGSAPWRAASKGFASRPFGSSPNRATPPALSRRMSP